MADNDERSPKPTRKLGRGLSEVSHLFISGESRPFKAKGPADAGGGHAAPGERRATQKREVRRREPAEDPNLWFPRATFVSITSGDGVRGKTFLAASLAFGLIQQGRRVAVVAADSGRPDIFDAIGGSRPTWPGSLGEASRAYGGIAAGDALAASNPLGSEISGSGLGSGLPGPPDSAVADSSPVDSARLDSAGSDSAPLTALETAARDARVVVIDAAPRGEASQTIWKTSTLCLVVAEPGAENLKSTYAAIKRIRAAGSSRIGLVINLVKSYPEGEACFRKLAEVCRKFLGINVRNYGYILYDEAVSEALRQAVPLVKAFPDSKAGKCIDSILGLIVMDESAIAKRRKEVTNEECALRKGRLEVLRS